jgi:glycosidase
MSAAPWWKHAVIYRVDPRGFGGLHGLASHLDYVHSIGVDALLLTSLGADAKQPIDPALGTLDDLDEIVRRASEYNIRVLVDLDAHAADLATTTRLWLAHGIAGFHAVEASGAQIAEIRRSLGGFAGQRIIVGDLSTGEDAAMRGTDAPQLIADGRAGTQEKFTAATVRPALEAAQQMVDQGASIPLLFSDGPALKRSIGRYDDGAHPVEIARAVATILLTTRAATMLYYGQELGLTDAASSGISFDQPRKGEQPAAMSVAAEDATPASLLNWYRQLSALAHSNRTISTGAMVTLNHDDQNVLAWVRRPQAVSLATPAVVIVENLSARPVTLSLKEDIQRLHLKGSFLRTVIRSDNAMGGMHLDSMTLPPFGVFIGELRY